MNISHEKTEGAVAGKLIVNIEKADYQDKVAASLKKIKQRAQMPGFRKGMVPMSLVQKMYGNEAKAEELQKVLSDAVNDYIKNEDLKVLGEPMIDESNEMGDLAKTDDFEFKFDLAFAPAVSVKVDGDTTVDYYNINVDDEAVEKQIDTLRRQRGTHTSAETFSEEDIVKGSLMENAEGEGAISIEESTLMPRFFNDDDQKALFANAKVGDNVVFCPAKAYKDRDAELGAFLKLDKEEAVKHDGEFTFCIKEINHFEPAELNEEFVKTACNDEKVTTVEDFKAYVRNEVEGIYKQDSDYKFMMDLKDALMKQAGELPLAEDLLKKMVLQNAKNEETKKQIETQFAGYIADLRWTLVRNECIKSMDLKIDDNAMLEESKRGIRIQMAQYGITNLPEEQLSQYAAERLKDPKQRDGIVENALNTALVNAAKSAVKLNEKTVSIAEFNKLFE